MKVCDLVQAYTPTSGGVRTYLHEKRRFLGADPSHTHVMIVPGAADEIRRDGRHATYVVRAPSVPGCAPYRFIVRPDRVAAILARERPDVVEVGSPCLLPWVAFGHRRRHGAVVAAFAHADFTTAYVAPLAARLGSAAGRALAALARRYARALYGRCDLTLAASAPLVAELRAGGAAAELLYLGVDTALFDPARRDTRMRRDMGIGDDQLLLIYAGRLDVEKRPNLVLDAFARLDPSLRARLLLVGEGPLRAELEGRARAVPGAAVLPYQADRQRLARLLASADVYVSAAPFETFGLSVVEAQASGLPVVGVAAGAMPERVPPELGLLAPAGSVADLAGCITTLALNGRIQKGEAARRHAVAAFSWEATFTRLLALYEAARSRTRPRGASGSPAAP